MQSSFIDIDCSQEVNNYCPDDYGPSDDVIDKFKDSSKKVNDFKNKKVNDFKNTVLIPHGLENKDSFYFDLLFCNTLATKK